MFTLNQAICLHMGGVMRGVGWGEGGSGFALPAAILQLHWLLWKEAVFIDWLGGARGPAGSQWGAGVKVQRDFNKAK